MNLPIRLRLTLWYSVLLAGALLVFSIVVYLVMANTLQSDFDRSLRDRLSQVSQETHIKSGKVSISQKEEKADVPSIPITLLGPNGRVVSGTLPSVIQRWFRTHRPTSRQQVTFNSVGEVRVAIDPITRRKGGIVGYLLVWQSLRSIETATHSLLLIMLAAGPILILAAWFGGLALARRALEPVVGITRAASTISATDLHRRVPLSPARDELRDLETTFNAMIERLEGSVDRERRFTADASHELRSPLAVIRAEATLALDRPRTEEQYRQALQNIDEQATSMEHLLVDLLALARNETSERRETVPISQLIEGVVAQVTPMAAGKDVRIETSCEEGLAVSGSYVLLTRAVSNVAENAIKASPPGGTVSIAGRRQGDEVVISVEDQGPGIPSEHRQQIFEPFYQIGPARTPGESHGLGLAITQRILAAHNGSIALDGAEGRGATFLIRLPLAQTAPVPDAQGMIGSTLAG